ncbi:hypothetical protein VB834_14970 [Limnoraphis robusta Tam1]|uniref:hypothetical protein n=1 Tax=Limnoraphis robusta TaxID=1118279 RepID=UPI002B207B79|nr:hypothetical protein [Limnoraphis robusta]MEA5540325.1 hypothetical protein [Limnoraphis robusta Tam1]
MPIDLYEFSKAGSSRTGSPRNCRDRDEKFKRERRSGKKGLVTPQEAIRYSMSMPIATLVSGIDSVEVLRQNIAIARDFQPMTAQEMQGLRERVIPYATDGRFELFKSSKKFDADVGRRQHGFPTQDQLPT